jgi:O-antigen/teichoic acid export membrane protein
VGGVLLLLGTWLVPLFYGAEYRPAYPALVILLIGYGFANIFNWNRTLLLAFEMPIYPLKVSGVFGFIKTALTFVLTPAWGYVAEAAILSGYFVGSITLMVRRGLREITQRSRAAIAE